LHIRLAGFNIDSDTIELVNAVVEEYRFGDMASARLEELLERLRNEPLTPETISAAYARISRSPKSVHELRCDARDSVNRARESNERIVFGFGHASVAEHAVFNLDVSDISRLVIEELEGHRLASYTESSQRYISQSGDYITPEEIKNSKYTAEYHTLCRELFDGYRQLSTKLDEYYSSLPERARSGIAREDSRYVLPLSCRGQVGVTMNARTAEHIIRQSATSRLKEAREMSAQMLTILRRATPSLIRHTEPNLKINTSYQALGASAEKVGVSSKSDSIRSVKLLAFPVEAEQTALAAMLFAAGKSSFQDAKNYVASLSEAKRQTLLWRAHGYLDAHSPLLREMELGVFLFEVELSASAFAQLKRHRIATIIKQDYLPELSITIPPSIEAVSLKSHFISYTNKSQEFYNILLKNLPTENRPAAQYVLTNAHRRRVLLQLNARELTHFSRLRQDADAQWDIRNIADDMIKLAREKCPMLLLFAAGKDKFDDFREKIERGGQDR